MCATDPIAELIASLGPDSVALPASAKAPLAALTALGEQEGDPSGRWRVLSYDALRDWLSSKKVPLTNMGSCEVRVSMDGPNFGQNNVVLTAEVDTGGELVQLRAGGVVALGDDDCGVVFLRCTAACGTDAFERVEAALAPDLPPGAIRAKLRLLHLAEELCVLQSDDGGHIVLQRLPDEDGEAEERSWDDEPDDEPDDEAEMLWIGSPY